MHSMTWRSMLDIRDFRLVEAVAHHGSLTRASSVLFLTQSALSHQLADLERRLGTPVFARTGKRMTLTPAGERLRAAGREILTATARAEADAREVARERSEVIRISTECYTCYHGLPAVMRAYREAQPRVEIRIVAEATRRPVAALMRGQLDIAVISSPARHARIDTMPLF